MTWNGAQSTRDPESRKWPSPGKPRMTADQPGFLELPKDGCKEPQASTEESGLSFDRSGSTAGMPKPAAENTVSPPSLIEMVKRDLTHQWEQGRQVTLE